MNLIDNINTDRTIKVSKSLQQNNSKSVTNENDKEKSNKKIYIFPEKRQKIIDNLKLI